jgi:hypothetical protein
MVVPPAHVGGDDGRQAAHGGASAKTWILVGFVEVPASSSDGDAGRS